MATRIILNLWSTWLMDLRQEHAQITITIGALPQPVLHLMFLQGILVQEHKAVDKRRCPSLYNNTHILVWSDTQLNEVWCVMTHGHSIAAIRAHSLEVIAVRCSAAHRPPNKDATSGYTNEPIGKYGAVIHRYDTTYVSR